MVTVKLPDVPRLSGPLYACNLLNFEGLSDRIRRSLRRIRHEKSAPCKNSDGDACTLFYTCHDAQIVISSRNHRKR